jgi:hypothetical protein
MRDLTAATGAEGGTAYTVCLTFCKPSDACTNELLCEFPTDRCPTYRCFSPNPCGSASCHNGCTEPM